jgi:serine/threonine protein kinase
VKSLKIGTYVQIIQQFKIHKDIMETPLPLSIGSGKYTIGRMIGRGGSCVVHEGLVVHNGARVAIKVLHSRYAQDTKRRLNNEIRVNMLVRDNRDAVRMIEVIEEGNDGAKRIYMIFDLMDGTIQKMVRKESYGFRLMLMADVMDGVLRMLEVIHGMKAVHRDVTSTNVMYSVDRDGRYAFKLCDFGCFSPLAYAEDPEGDTMTYYIVTLPFRSPELLRMIRDRNDRRKRIKEGIDDEKENKRRKANKIYVLHPAIRHSPTGPKDATGPTGATGPKDTTGGSTGSADVIVIDCTPEDDEKDQDQKDQKDQKHQKHQKIKYGCEIDMWALGCVMFHYVFKNFPFGGDTSETVLSSVDADHATVIERLENEKRVRWNDDLHEDQKRIIDKCFDLVIRMLSIREDGRPTATEALKEIREARYTLFTANEI